VSISGKLAVYNTTTGVNQALTVNSGAATSGDAMQVFKQYGTNFCIRVDSIPNTYPANFIYFATNTGGTNTGTITATNATTMAYGSASDYRIKSNVVPLSNAISFINQFNPINFTFNVNPTEVVGGFLAHEFKEIIPCAVSGEKDAVDENGNIMIQNLDNSFIIPYLTAAVQQLSAQNTALEARLAAVEGK
jgi:hypothetical protein